MRICADDDRVAPRSLRSFTAHRFPLLEWPASACGSGIRLSKEERQVHKEWVEFTYPSSVIDGASRVMFLFPFYAMDSEDPEPAGWVDTEKASDDQIQEYVAFLRRCIKTARHEIDGFGSTRAGRRNGPNGLARCPQTRQVRRASSCTARRSPSQGLARTRRGGAGARRSRAGAGARQGVPGCPGALSAGARSNGARARNRSPASDSA
jgi:hypothetical protein